MSKVDLYLQASIRENTQKSYATAIQHYEFEWHGLLPATADNISHYLSDYAGILSINTLKQRIAALSQWHIEQGFPDPTKAPIVKKVLKGIKTVHPVQEKQAKPLQLSQLKQTIDYLDQVIEQSKNSGEHAKHLRYTRNKSLLLLGFWRGFRGDELTRLNIENIEINSEGLRCYLAKTKGDRALSGKYFFVPKLNQLCPVKAYLDWLEVSELTSGTVFRSINRWGKTSTNALHIDSLIPLIRNIFMEAEIEFAELYSAHSLRRGFAQWANSNGWDIKTLMEYVGWKNLNSAIRYINVENNHTFTINET
ncbi:tyrosine-type recombinase/integrase [Acinetobacter modestus]|uniref:tyrosine-type recombinase/integrase n=1 Tax=Acinetobacter modestus TaxID=1776740 RepID=UPI00202F4CF0|nr:tyrosine-type recombinase/integrase [Acinetobacter modestus]MCM1959074.1 tyrosine-type recombinase/integrase [Acinetobacter modestus]